MNYRRVYMIIVNHAKQEELQGIRKRYNGNYYERHHILPKSLFPNWAKRKSNLVLLTAREHFFCHQLLTKIYGKGMWKALFMMMTMKNGSHMKRNYKFSSRVYEEVRIEAAKEHSKILVEKHLKPWNLGKIFSNEAKQKLREAHIGKLLTEEHKQKISDSLKGRKHTVDQFKKNSEKMTKKIEEAVNGNYDKDQFYELFKDTKLKGKVCGNTKITFKRRGYDIWCESTSPKNKTIYYRRINDE